MSELAGQSPDFSFPPDYFSNPDIRKQLAFDYAKANYAAFISLGAELTSLYLSGELQGKPEEHPAYREAERAWHDAETHLTRMAQFLE